MARRQTLRGSTLDEAIDALLAQMISSGVELAPISRPEVQRRLGLTSRATLGGDRGDRIEAARIVQMRESGGIRMVPAGAEVSKSVLQVFKRRTLRWQDSETSFSRLCQ